MIEYQMNIREESFGATILNLKKWSKRIFKYEWTEKIIRIWNFSK